MFVPGNYYHVFNRAVVGNRLFSEDENYAFFLKKYDEYMSGYVETYCYCLLPNHFHFLIRVRNIISSKEKLNNSDKINEQFRKFFISYSMSYNRIIGRNGTLFQRTFKKKLVDKDEYLTCLVYYIHSNPEKHFVTSNFGYYKWSSYMTILSPKETKLNRRDVLHWFGGLDGFKRFHEEIQELNKISHLMMD